MWTFLKSGDSIALVAPGALPVPCEPGRSLDQARESSWKLLDDLARAYTSCGLQASFYGDLCPEETYLGYYAAPVKVRADALAHALACPDIKAIVCVRGGFGAKQVVAFWAEQGINPFGTPSHPKPLVGFSDTTYLLSVAHHQGLFPIHGPVGLNPLVHGQEVTVSQEAVAQTAALLGGQIPELKSSWTLLTPALSPAHPLTGRVLGGNGSVLQRSIATPYGLKGQGAFVFLEDCEDPKRFLDLFLHLVESGALGTREYPAQALLVGYLSFIDRHPEVQARHRLWQETVQGFQTCLRAYGLGAVPLFHNPDFGHGVCNHLLPLGLPAALSPLEGGEMFELKIPLKPLPV